MDRAITVARFTQVMRRWVCAAAVLSSSRISGTKVRRTYVGRLECGESGGTVEALAAILAALGVRSSCRLHLACYLNCLCLLFRIPS